MPLVSVCVFTNRDARLNKTLQSVINQELPLDISLEIRVIDNSSDRTAAYMSKNLKKKHQH